MALHGVLLTRQETVYTVSFDAGVIQNLAGTVPRQVVKHGENGLGGDWHGKKRWLFRVI